MSKKEIGLLLFAVLGGAAIGTCLSYTASFVQTQDYQNAVELGALGLLLLLIYVTVLMAYLPEPYNAFIGFIFVMAGIFLLWGTVIATLLWATTFVSPFVNFSWIFVGIVSGVGTVITGVVLRLKGTL